MNTEKTLGTIVTLLVAMCAVADIPRPEYPRPQFVRDAWRNLNGDAWTFEYDNERTGMERKLFESRGFADRIVVPFAPQSVLSGVGNTDFIKGMWYHRKIEIPQEWAGKRILLNFGAVDWESEVFIDGEHAALHFGGCSSFSADVTRLVKPGGTHDLVVRVVDDVPLSPSGKQSNKRESYGCLYTRVTGIWQTVWMEAVDPSGLASCRTVPDADNGTFVFSPTFHGGGAARFAVSVMADGKKVGGGEWAAADGMQFSVAPSVRRLWSPEDPFLYDVEYEVKDASGAVIDRVKSYAGLRTVRVKGNRVLLNGKPLYFRLVLDQGYYPDGIWTAPSDAALKRDVELGLEAGFNGARLHQKVFEERFHYWADKLGYLTWGEYASWGADVEQPVAARNALAEWAEVMQRDINHPSIVAWTPLNETHSKDANAHRRGLSDMYNLTKALDPTRPCNESSGYQHWKTDLWTVHNYYRARGTGMPDKTYINDLDQGPNAVWYYEKHKPPKSAEYGGQPYINDEFGGVMYVPPERRSEAEKNAWGYGGSGNTPTAEDGFFALVKPEVDVQNAIPTLSGWCYTQLYDVEQERNGIYNYDRTPKFDMKRVRETFSAEPK